VPGIPCLVPVGIIRFLQKYNVFLGFFESFLIQCFVNTILWTFYHQLSYILGRYEPYLSPTNGIPFINWYHCLYYFLSLVPLFLKRFSTMNKISQLG